MSKVAIDVGTELVTITERRLRSALADVQNATGQDIAAMAAAQDNKELDGDYSVMAKDLDLTARTPEGPDGAASSYLGLYSFGGEVAPGMPAKNGFVNITATGGLTMNVGRPRLSFFRRGGLPQKGLEDGEVELDGGPKGKITLWAGPPITGGPTLTLDSTNPASPSLSMKVGPPGGQSSITLEQTGLTLQFGQWKLVLNPAGIALTVGVNKIQVTPENIRLTSLEGYPSLELNPQFLNMEAPSIVIKGTDLLEDVMEVTRSFMMCKLG
jgi:hypothetical protein